MFRPNLSLARLIAGMASAGLALSGCSTYVPSGGNGLYATPLSGAPVTANPTPYTDALLCLQQYARAHNIASPVIAVGRIEDKTGKVETDGSGRKITGGASEMAMTAFAKAGATQVDNFDTSISEIQLRYSSQKLISDSGQQTPGQPQPYRQTYAGQVVGANFAFQGSITELNWNIVTQGFDANGGTQGARATTGHIGNQVYVLNIATDLRLTDVISQRIVDVKSYQKQIYGYQVGAGLFSLLGGHVYDLSAGKGQLEPVQLAVRTLIERTVVEMMANFYGMPSPRACLAYDPLDDGFQTAGQTGAFIPAYNNLQTNNAATQADPDRWNANRDRYIGQSRGRY